MMPDRDGNGHGHGHVAAVDAQPADVRFFLEDPWEDGGGDAARATAGSRLGAAREALRNALRAERDERHRAARATLDGLTPANAALLAARQAQSHAAEATIADLRRRAASLRQAITLAEQGLLAQQRLIERLRRELAEIGE